MNNLGKIGICTFDACMAGMEESAVRTSRTLSQAPRTYTHCTCDVPPDKCFFWTAEPQFCPKTPYFKTQSYLLLVCLQLREPVFTKELSPILIHLIRLRICYSNEILIFQSEEFYLNFI